MNAAAEAERRWPIIDDQERMWDDNTRTGFTLGAEWHASLPITDDEIGAVAWMIGEAVKYSDAPGFDAFHMARVLLETVRGMRA